MSVCPECLYSSFSGGFLSSNREKKKEVVLLINIVVIIIWCHWMILSFYGVRPLRKFRLDHYLVGIILLQYLSGLFKCYLNVCPSVHRDLN